MSTFLEGATMFASFGIAVFFLRYWRDTGDRLFAVLCAAFMLYGANRIALFVLAETSEARVWPYALRAATFLMIIVAVVDKNVSRSAKTPPRGRHPDHRWPPSS